MQIPFRQGIVQCSQDTLGQPTFLQKIGNDIFISTTGGPLLATFSQSTSEYLLRERDNAQFVAWIGPFLTTLNYWLYWDLNVINGVKTYGATIHQPISGSITPSNPPLDQHFFSTIDHKMYVWNGTSWVNKIRVFAGLLPNTQITNQYALIGGNSVNKKFYVAGNITATLTIGDVVTVIDGGLNNGSYNITAYIYNSTLDQTEITVQQNIPFATIVGYLLHTPLIVIPSALIAYSPGSQVNDNTTILSGFIFYDQNGNAVKLNNGLFFTTESPFIVSSGQTQPLKLEETFIFGNVSQNMAAYQVISVDSTNGTIFNPAVYEDTGEKVLGIILNDALAGQQAIAAIQGTVDNPNWTWPGPNITLWVDTGGTLVDVDPNVTNPSRPKAPPVARTVTSTKTIFNQGLGGLGLPGPQGPQGSNPDASTTIKGITKLTLAPAVPTNPLAVGDNDPRMTDPRVPLSHVHPATEVDLTAIPGTILAIPVDSQTAFSLVANDLKNKVSKSGDIMTGVLDMSNHKIQGVSNPTISTDAVNLGTLTNTLAGYLPLVGGTMLGYINLGAFATPISATQAASKGYVDGKVSKAGDTMTGLLVLSADPVAALGAATKQYVDNTAVSIAGDTMTGFLILNADPVANLGAATKQYVDTAVLSGSIQVPPIIDPNLIDIRSTQPIISTGIVGDSVTYIKYGGIQGETWVQTGTSIVVDDGDIATFTITDTTPYEGNWSIIEQGPLAIGSRFLVAAESGTVGATLSGMGFVNDDLVQYNGGIVTTAANWSTPSGSPPANGTTTFVTDPESVHYGNTYFYSTAGAEWVRIGGPEVLALNDLTDVTITTPAYNDVLYYDGTKWVNEPHRPRIVSVPYAAMVTIDWSVADIIRITLTGNIQITNSGAYDGQRCMLELTQDGTGGRSVVFTSEVRFGSDIIAYAPSSTPTAMDRLGFVFNLSANKYDVVALVTGFV